MDALPRGSEIYAKTQEGTNALSLPRSALSFSARQLLILIDGRRSVADLSSIFDMRSLERSLTELREHGYIEAVRRAPAPELKVPEPAPLEAAAPLTREAPAAGPRRNRLAIVVGLLLGVTAAVWVLLLRTVGTTGSGPAVIEPQAARPAAAEPAGPAATAPPAAAPVQAAPTPASHAVAQASRPKPTPSYTAADEATEALRRQNATLPAAGAAPGAAPAPAPAAPTSGGAPAAASASAPLAIAAPGAPAPTSVSVPTPDGAGTATLHVRTQVTPQMPQKAKDLGIDSGKVVVVLHVDPKGSVERVELVSATPPEVYDAAMEQAFQKWTFDPLGIPGRMTVEVEIRPQN